MYVNGAIHWLAYKRPRFRSAPDSIMAFDMSAEVFKEMGLPKSGFSNQLQLCASAFGETISMFLKFHNWKVWLV